MVRVLEEKVDDIQLTIVATGQVEKMIEESLGEFGEAGEISGTILGGSRSATTTDQPTRSSDSNVQLLLVASSKTQCEATLKEM